MSLHRVKIDDVYVRDFYHNALNTIAVCIEGTMMDEEGRMKTEATNGKIQLEYDSSNFSFKEGADVVREMHKLKEAFLLHRGRVINLDCQV